MISELRITGLGVIADATVELDPGLTAVTGETGAGKTMVVTGLGLLLGQRADSGAVRTGLDRARVEGRFVLPDRLLPALEKAGGAIEDDELLVARQVSAQGRSRCWLAGAQVPLSSCAALLGEIITIHGQSEQLRLAAPDHQRELLDRSGGESIAALLADYAQTWQQRRTVDVELGALTESARERVREADMLQHALQEIATIDPQSGEDHELAIEANRLQDVDDLRAEAHLAVSALTGDDEDPGSGALAAAAVAERAAAALSGRDPSVVPSLDALRQIRIMLGDVAADLSRYLDRLEADPLRLETITARRSALAGLTRKYGADVDEVLVWAQTSAQRLADLGGSDDRIAELTAERERLHGRLAGLSAQLTEARSVAASRIRDAVGSELAALAMPKARLEFVVSQLAELGPYGGDRVDLQFSANPGSQPRSIGKVASGGELSRIRLALEVVLADGASGQTYVFDEVDSGVGGAVAVEIGRRLATLARHSQVIVVTHLAQVAAFADRHLVVAKSDDGEITTSGVRAVDDNARAAELARMMAGLETTEVSLAHAEELLAEARG